MDKGRKINAGMKYDLPIFTGFQINAILKFEVVLRIDFWVLRIDYQEISI